MRFHTLAVSIVASVALSLSCLAVEQAQLVGIEEDWSLQIATPDQNAGAPHVMVQIGSDALGAVGIVTLNYQDAFDFAEGGVELQLWSNGILRDSHAGNDGKILVAENETITWTQSVRVDDGELVFHLKNGVSASFGSFGGEEFEVSQNTLLNNLDAYNPVDSLKNSGITLGSNRVQRLQLIRYRKYYSDGTVQTVSLEKASYYAVSDSAGGTSTSLNGTDSTTTSPTTLSTSSGSDLIFSSYNTTDYATLDGATTTTDGTTTVKTTATLGGADY